MLNMIDTQDKLKNFSEGQLIQEMQRPSGSAPQFMVLGEIERRKRIRADAQKQEGLMQPTVAQEAVSAAGVPQQGIAQVAQSLAPKTDMTQNTGVPNVQAAGLPAQPNQPQRMAGGGIMRLAPGGIMSGGDMAAIARLKVSNPALYEQYKNDPEKLAQVVEALSSGELARLGDSGGGVGVTTQFEDLMNRVSVVEGTSDAGGYDRLLDKGEKGTFANSKPLSEMTVGEAVAFGQSDEYRNYSRKMLGRGPDELPSTPMGKYQIVGDTLADLVKRGIANPDAMFDSKTQDQLGAYLINNRGYDKVLRGSMSSEEFEANLGSEFQGIAEKGLNMPIGNLGGPRDRENSLTQEGGIDVQGLNTAYNNNFNPSVPPQLDPVVAPEETAIDNTLLPGLVYTPGGEGPIKTTALPGLGQILNPNEDQSRMRLSTGDNESSSSYLGPSSEVRSPENTEPGFAQKFKDYLERVEERAQKERDRYNNNIGRFNAAERQGNAMGAAAEVFAPPNPYEIKMQKKIDDAERDKRIADEDLAMAQVGIASVKPKADTKPFKSTASKLDQSQWLSLAQAGLTLMSTGNFAQAGQAGIAAYKDLTSIDLAKAKAGMRKPVTGAYLKDMRERLNALVDQRDNQLTPPNKMGFLRGNAINDPDKVARERINKQIGELERAINQAYRSSNININTADSKNTAYDVTS